jgi:hypothetical protein
MSRELNPYAPPSPAASEPLTKAPVRDKGFWRDPYVSARPRAYVAMALTAGYLVASLIVVLAMWNQIGLLERVAGGQTLSTDEANANDMFAMLSGVGSMLMALGATIVMLFWIYAAHRNLPALGTAHPEFTPGWAVGWWFIPIMNLFKPCQAMLELARGSDPGRHVKGMTQGLRARGTGFIVVWWLSRIISTIVGQAIMRYDVNEDSLPDLINLSWLVLVSVLATDLPVALLQLWVIWRIDQDQEIRQRLADSTVETAGDGFANPYAPAEPFPAAGQELA